MKAILLFLAITALADAIPHYSAAPPEPCEIQFTNGTKIGSYSLCPPTIHNCEPADLNELRSSGALPENVMSISFCNPVSYICFTHLFYCLSYGRAA